MALHRLLGWIAFYFPAFEKLIKGRADVLVREGKPLAKTLKSHKVSEDDLMEEVRLNGEINDLEEVQTATLERNGEISVISRK